MNWCNMIGITEEECVQRPSSEVDNDNNVDKEEEEEKQEAVEDGRAMIIAGGSSSRKHNDGIFFSFRRMRLCSRNGK